MQRSLVGLFPVKVPCGRATARIVFPFHSTCPCVRAVRRGHSSPHVAVLAPALTGYRYGSSSTPTPGAPDRRSVSAQASAARATPPRPPASVSGAATDGAGKDSTGPFMTPLHNGDEDAAADTHTSEGRREQTDSDADPTAWDDDAEASSTAAVEEGGSAGGDAADAAGEHAQEDSDETLSDDDGPRIEADMWTQTGKLLRDAEASLRVEELLSPANINKFVYVSEVFTATGVRWLDVWARPSLWQNRILARQPKAQFAACVAKALAQQAMPSGMISSIETSGALPSVQVDEHVVCLSLRVAKGLSSRALGSSRGGSAAGGYGGFGDPTDPPPLPTPKRPLEKGKEEKRKTSSPAARGPHGRVSAKQRKRSQGDADRDDPASFYIYDEDKNQFYLLRRQPRKGSRLSLLRACLSPLRSMHADKEQRSANGRKPRRGRRRANLDESFAAMKAPTITEDTERLNVFVRKEVHPVEKAKKRDKADKDEAGKGESHLSREARSSATKLGHLFEDAYGNRVFNPTTKQSTAPLKAGVSIGLPPSAPSATAASDCCPEGADTCAASLPSSLPSAQADRDAIPGDATEHPPRQMKKSESNGSSNLNLRWVVVTVHREPIPFVAETLQRWQEFITHGGRLRSEDNATIMQRSVAKSKDVGWEDIVCHLFREDIRGLHRASVAQARALERMEMDVFDSDAGAGDRMQRMRRMLRELHLLSRRADIYTDVLKESRIAFHQLKKALNSPLTSSDRKAISALDSAVSLSRSLEDQSRALLMLQFSVGMYEMERHLRTLTIFSTFFTPISFIASYFSMHFELLEEFCRHDRNFVFFLALIAATVLTTSRWISRNVS